MNGWDIAVTVIVGLAVICVVGRLIYKKVKHKGGCSECGCNGCTACRKGKTDV